MLKRISLKALGIFLLFCGMGMIEMAFTEPDFELASRIFSGICGLILFAGGALFVFKPLEKALDLNSKAINDEVYWNGPRYAGMKGRKAAKLLRELRSDMSPHFLIASVDHDDTEKLIRTFRKDYSAFFECSEIAENDAIQNDATQILWHMLSLQKRRLDRKKIRMMNDSERLHYGNLEPVRSDCFFDGKYRILDVSETVEACQTFLTGAGKKIYKRKSLQTAWYRILHVAKQPGSELTLCPNCGHAASRENLIDGCDYCGTKFAVEDLGFRVSEFCYKPDCEAEYARYTDVRKTYGKRVALIVGVPISVLCVLSVLASASWSGAYTLRIAGAMFAAAFPAFAAILLAEILFFVFFFPLLQAKASITYYSKRRMKKMQQQQQEDNRAEQQIRTQDPLFSLAGFYADVQNKLSVIHFAEKLQDAAAFAFDEAAEDQISAHLPQYRDLISMETESISLSGYRVTQRFQEADVTVTLSLLAEKNDKSIKRKETVRLRMVKSPDCKTQAVCSPAFTVCKKCGAPMSLLDGRICSYCGGARNLAEVDWTIREYEILS